VNFGDNGFIACRGVVRGPACPAIPSDSMLMSIVRLPSFPRWTWLLGLGLALAAGAAQAADAEVDFAREIQPLLARRCYACHGPDKGEGGLRLNQSEAALAELESGEHAIVPGKPDASELLVRVTSTDEDTRMPPEGKPLTEKEVAALRRWIAQGAKFQPHWAYEKSPRPTVPEVKDKAWVKNPIDAFVLAKLEAKGLKPVGPAGKGELLRRLYYDLTGLPPSANEVADFVADDSSDAYEKVVDKLLASERYGERWARHWLDVVRFAETNSFERDGLKPHAWRYRDYVIRAFNTDKPYDQFVKEQLAGDEMPNPSSDAIIATGYYRLGLWDDEPADRELAKFDAYDDLVTTTSQGFLGITLNCARCHDHKIDPLLTKDYYSMVAFFRGVTSMAYGGPQVERPVFDDDASKAAFDNALADIRREQDDMQAKLTEIELEFQQKFIPAGESDLEDLEYRYYLEAFTALPDFDKRKPSKTGKVKSQLFDLSLATRDGDFAFVFTGNLKVSADGEYTFVADADDGIRLSIDGKQVAIRDGIHGVGEPQTAKVTLKKGKVPIRIDYFQAYGGQGLIVTWKGPGVDDRMLSAAGNDLHFNQRKGPPGKRDAEGVAGLIQQQGEKVLGKERAGQYSQYRARLEELKKQKPASPMALAVSEYSTTPPDTFVLNRGSHLSPGDKVVPEFVKILGGGVPEIKPIDSANSSGRRTALANWIASPENPLTARVMANRIWQHHFGRGIVRSPNNFGLLGDPPTHRELLDYLASEFVQLDWRMKPLHKLIVMSNTYRMSSQATPKELAADPANDLFWRFNMRRLSAEEVRDSLLAVNGTLNPKMYGPGVYPTMSKEVLAGQSVPGQGWGKSSPEEQARRTIYVHVKRSLVTPLLSAFDFPDTDTTCEARFHTTQPGQALALLNGDFLNNEATALAERVKKEAGDDVKAQVATAIKLVLARDAEEKEVARGLALIERLQKEHGQTAEQALKHYCLFVYNLNEFIYLD
jgi:mono/diheme cytochrome c family protein